MLSGASALGTEEPWTIREWGSKGPFCSTVLMQGLLGPSHYHSSRQLAPRTGYKACRATGSS